MDISVIVVSHSMNMVYSFFTYLFLEFSKYFMVFYIKVLQILANSTPIHSDTYCYYKQYLY